MVRKWKCSFVHSGTPEAMQKILCNYVSFLNVTSHQSIILTSCSHLYLWMIYNIDRWRPRLSASTQDRLCIMFCWLRWQVRGHMSRLLLREGFHNWAETTSCGTSSISGNIFNEQNNSSTICHLQSSTKLIRLVLSVPRLHKIKVRNGHTSDFIIASSTML